MASRVYRFVRSKLEESSRRFNGLKSPRASDGGGGGTCRARISKSKEKWIIFNFFNHIWFQKSSPAVSVKMLKSPFCADSPMSCHFFLVSQKAEIPPSASFAIAFSGHVRKSKTKCFKGEKRYCHLASFHLFLFEAVMFINWNVAYIWIFGWHHGSSMQTNYLLLVLLFFFLCLTT